ncbi:hypothetical protein MU516_16100 [Paracoccus sp. YLB-12]|uniref:Uncharacterized protein n=1 Tax=Paracoccus maritimus TaxID=2933292 RepID=A0ABT2KEV5_9RHOB|nr:hypothetical protein [Paracoccus sp. YLB-12]MCT4334385.1 hypothetical protein [Paracoccus sp. YLB-12]
MTSKKKDSDEMMAEHFFGSFEDDQGREIKDNPGSNTPSSAIGDRKMALKKKLNASTPVTTKI